MARIEIRQGDIWLADLGEPRGSIAGYRRPVIVVQGDRVNASRLATSLVVPVTGNLRLAGLATNMLLPASQTGLPHDSVAQLALLLAVDRSHFIEPLGAVRDRMIQQLFERLDLVLGRT